MYHDRLMKYCGSPNNAVMIILLSLSLTNFIVHTMTTEVPGELEWPVICF
jgi:hypothetical protein